MAKDTQKTTEKVGKIKLTRVRLSFPHLFTPQQSREADGKAKYNASLLIDVGTPEGAALKKSVDRVIAEVKKAKWADKQPKISPDRVCLRDGDLMDYAGYEGKWYIAASNTEQPVMIDRKKDRNGKWVRLTDEDGDPINGAEGLLYAGCYVNAIVNIWAQDNHFGKRINASLEAVQFVAHGEAFSSRTIDADEEFDDEDAGFSEDDDAELEDANDMI